MTAFIFASTLMILLLSAELVLSAFGIWVPFSFLGLHYLAFSRKLPLRIPLILLFAAVTDALYGHVFPLTLLSAGIFVLLMNQIPFFRRLSMLHQSIPGGVFAGVATLLNLLPGLAAAAPDAETLKTVLSFVAFASCINVLFTPLAFAFFDWLAGGVGIPRAFDPLSAYQEAETL